MNTRTFTLLIMLLLMSAASIIGQEKTEKSGERLVITPEMKEWGERQYKMLQKGDFAQLKIEPMPLELSGADQKPAGRYQAGSKISFQLLITNIMEEPVEIEVSSDYYYYNRPELFRGGQLVPYREDIIKLVKAKGKPTDISVRPVTLEHDKGFSEAIDLSDWYEPLEAGRYQLIMRRRFIEGGEWVESAGIMFEVDPK